MSWEVFELVKSRKVGSPTKKAILIYMALAADDDGKEIYYSKSRIAAELELGRRTVQENIDKFEKTGLLKEVGKRACSSGYVCEYDIDLAVLRALPPTRKNDEQRASGRKDVREPRMSGAAAAHQGARVPHTNHNRKTKKDEWAEKNALGANSVRAESGNMSAENREDQERLKLQLFAEAINYGRYVAPSALTTSQAAEMLRIGLVTKEQLRAAGIAH